MTPPLTRRELLLLLAGLGAGCVLPRGEATDETGVAVGHARTLFRGIPFDEDSLARCADLYFAQRPEERNAALLESRIFGAGPSDRSPRVLLATVSERVADDFARDDVVVLDGWTLAATEVRLWSLVHLTPEREGTSSRSGGVS